MANLFFSYSHRDEVLRDELEIHLASLKRQGVLTTWHDRRISAGNEFDHSISEHLKYADIVLLLISPYFIASDYCFEVEMSGALERHENKKSIVMPVILHPCDWHDMPFGKLLGQILGTPYLIIEKRNPARRRIIKYGVPETIQYLQEKISAADLPFDRQSHGGHGLCQGDTSGEGITIDRERHSALPALQAGADAVQGKFACM